MPPLGGLIRLASRGVEKAADHLESRKQQKMAQQVVQPEASSSRSQQPQTYLSPSQPVEDPPAYTEAADAHRRDSHRSGQSSEKKVVLDDNGSDDSSSDSDDEADDDEEDWALDEALPSYEDVQSTPRTTEQYVRETLSADQHNATDRKIRPHQPLPFPVIIPQRRPGTKTRGFVRAYAPILDDCSGIDQATFISFLENYQKASEGSPTFTVVGAAAGIAGLAPSVIASAVSAGIQVAAKAGSEMQHRQQTKTFLGQMNEQLFAPAGLQAIVIKYQPVGTNGEVNPHPDEMIAAPLIFPAMEDVLASPGAEKTFKDRARNAGVQLQEYLDRRAQTAYTRNVPVAQSISPEEQQGPLIHPAYRTPSLLENISASRERKAEKRAHSRERHAERRFAKRERKALRFEDKMARGKHVSRKQQRRYARHVGERELWRGEGAGCSSSVQPRRNKCERKRKMRTDVMYLMIVNMPSPEELVEARERID